MRRMAQEVKGWSYTVGAREMAQICRELERESEEQDWTEIEKLYVALGLAFARVRECLQHKDKMLTEIMRSA